MKRARHHFGTLVVAVALWLELVTIGCKPALPKATESTDEKTSAAPAETAGVKFKAGKGLLLSEATQRAIGLQVADVTEETFTPETTAEADVYQAGATSHPALALARVRPEIARRLRVGQAVTLHSAVGRTASGKITRIDSATEPFVGQAEVLLQVPEPAPVGSTFMTTIPLGEAKAMTAVPRSAVLSAAEGPFVYVVNGQHLLRTLIKTGGENSQWIEVTDGLYPGDKIVAHPVETLWMAELRAVKGGGDSD